mgnify:CR=1 FL=1
MGNNRDCAAYYTIIGRVNPYQPTTSDETSGETSEEASLRAFPFLLFEDLFFFVFFCESVSPSF